MIVRLSFCSIIAVAWFGVSAIPRACADTPDAKQSLELLFSAIQGIQTYDVTVDATLKHMLKQEFAVQADSSMKLVSSRKLRPGEQPATQTRHYRQVYQRGKARVEFFDPSGQLDRTTVSDGEAQKTLNLKGPHAVISGMGVQTVPDGENYAGTYRTLLGNVEIAKVFRERGNAKLTLSKNTKLITVDSPPVSGTRLDLADWGFRVTFDPDRRCMPVVLQPYEMYDGKPRPLWTLTVNEFRSVDGVPVPVRFTTQWTDYIGKETYGEIDGEMVAAVDVSRSSWNKELPAATFELPLPAGIRVSDQLHRISYVTGKPDPGKNLAALAANAEEVMPMTASYGGEPSAAWRWQYWTIGALGIGLVAAVGAIFFRRRIKGGK